MRSTDLLRFTLLAINRQRFRSAMLLIAVGIGVAAVLVLVALGEGARDYVLGEFSYIGKDTLVMLPGRKSTSGGMPPMTGVAARDITLDEVMMIQRSVHAVEQVAPIVIGTAAVSHRNRERDATVLGTNAAFFAVRQLSIAQGSLLPESEVREAAQVAVIGQKLKLELFGNRRAIGQWIRLREYRFRVIGILEGSGDSFGLDLSEAIFIPVASAQSVFNVHGLFRVVLSVREGADTLSLKQELLELMKSLHQGEEDVTIISPDAMIKTFDNILRALTLGVSGIAAISLLVAGILVMNLTLISVSQRTPEIGLLKALGATDQQVRLIFLTEAGTLATLGTLGGILVGGIALLLLQRLFPALPIHVSLWALLSSCAMALFTALLFAWIPAARAARLPPVLALGKR